MAFGGSTQRKEIKSKDMIINSQSMNEVKTRNTNLNSQEWGLSMGFNLNHERLNPRYFLKNHFRQSSEIQFFVKE